MALYKDDLQDLAAHLKLRYMRPRREFHPLVWETSSAYAGYGRGLCKAWHNDTECWQEEEREMLDVPLLSVHYSHTALTVALAEINGAGGLWEPEYRHVENFTLGRDALDDYAHEKDYWEDVREHLVFFMVEYGFRNPELVMITGDAADGEFLEHVKSTMLRHMGKVRRSFLKSLFLPPPRALLSLCGVDRWSHGLSEHIGARPWLSLAPFPPSVYSFLFLVLLFGDKPLAFEVIITTLF